MVPQRGSALAVDGVLQLLQPRLRQAAGALGEHLIGDLRWCNNGRQHDLSVYLSFAWYYNLGCVKVKFLFRRQKTSIRFWKSSDIPPSSIFFSWSLKQIEYMRIEVKRRASWVAFFA
jgi:hypothetical protein